MERGHEVSVFCPQTFSKYTTASSTPKRSSSSALKVYSSPRTPLPLSTTIPHLYSMSKVLRRRFDLVITQFHLFHSASFVGFVSKILKGMHWVVRVHDMIPDQSISYPLLERMFISSCYGAFIRSIGKRADRLLVLTEELRSLLIRNGHLSTRIAVMPNGVDTGTFCPAASNDDSSSERLILYTGSLMAEDGVDRLIRAFSLLDLQSQLAIIGDGPERLRLVELAARLGLNEKVAFYRYVPHNLVPKFIRGAYLTVGPLRFSPINAFTIPTKILEYFACGKPVVSSPVSKDILIDGFNGYVIEDSTPKRIAEKLSVLMEDEGLVARLGKNARQLVEQRFDWMKIIDSLEKEIEEVAKV